MTINSMIQFIAVPGGTLLLVIFVSWKYMIPKFLDTALEQRLKEKQHDLDKELEEHKERIKHELHKEHLRVAARFNKINEMYPKLFSWLYELKSKVSSFQAQWKQNWVSASDDEITGILKEKKFGEKLIKDLIHDLRAEPDKNKANDKLAQIVFDRDLETALFDLHEVIHFIKSNSLFLSKEVKLHSTELAKTLQSARSKLSLAYNKNVGSSTDYFMEASNHLSNSEENLKNLEAVMRSELSPYD